MGYKRERGGKESQEIVGPAEKVMDREPGEAPLTRLRGTCNATRKMQLIRLVSGRYHNDATLRGGAECGWFCGWVALAHANVHLLSYLASTQPVFRAVCQLVREGKLQREIGGIGAPLQRHRVPPRMTTAPSL